MMGRREPPIIDYYDRFSDLRRSRYENNSNPLLFISKQTHTVATKQKKNFQNIKNKSNILTEFL